MAFDEGLAHRLRELFEDEPSISEEEAFGQESRNAKKHPLESS